MNHPVYLALIDDHANAANYLVFADVLEDEGDTQTAAAYRWAGTNGCKWPFQRTQRQYDTLTEKKVFDWEGEHRNLNSANIPPSARIPKELYHTIRQLPDREYGEEPHDAFVLLGRAMASSTTTLLAKP